VQEDYFTNKEKMKRMKAKWSIKKKSLSPVVLAKKGSQTTKRPIPQTTKRPNDQSPKRLKM